ncbi:thiol reductant ABC exporter subunit CydD [Salinicola halophilus]|uniref:thiol reductant ABC exporter subunit CydD n=1 Tax=Salinicola halophilus TaxID=184065 RepID=UPI000DA12AED|nr:thiol reductant ABC exporter subunit CydD [Salinicola halophilus]
MAVSQRPSHGGEAKRHERWLKDRAGAVKGTLMLATGSGLVGGLALIAQCWLVARVLDATIIDGAGLNEVWQWLWPLLGVFALRALASIASDALAFEAAARLKRTLRDQVMNRLAALGPRWMEGQRSGEIANVLGGAVEGIEQYVAAYLPQKLLSAMIPLAILVAVLPLDWVSGLILLVTAPILPLFMVIVGRGAEALNQRQWRRLSLMGAHFFDAIEGLTTLKQFGASRREAEAVGRMADEYRSATMRVLRVAFLSSLVLEFFATLGVAMVAVYVGFRLYYGQLDFLPGLFALLLAPEFYRPLRDMGANYHARMEAIGAVGELAPVLETEAETRDESEGETQGDAKDETDAAAQTRTARPLPSDPIRTIRFDGVGFRHDAANEDGDGVESVDLTLARGECVALVGPSGAGKTTLAKLLLGFLAPGAGRIEIDGVDLREIDVEAWRARLGYLPQRPTLFAGTIAENLTLGAPNATPDEIHAALLRADAQGFVAALEDGLDTWLGDGGSGLSGGQIQRLALARTLLSQPEVLILDEPTAALDGDTARRVMAGVHSASANAATLLVTHDIDVARTADRLVFLDRGHVVEQGTPAALEATGGAFARFALLAEEGAA